MGDFGKNLAFWFTKVLAKNAFYRSLSFGILFSVIMTLIIGGIEGVFLFKKDFPFIMVSSYALGGNNLRFVCLAVLYSGLLGRAKCPRRFVDAIAKTTRRLLAGPFADLDNQRRENRIRMGCEPLYDRHRAT
jgi:hypothetical protein